MTAPRSHRSSISASTAERGAALSSFLDEARRAHRDARMRELFGDDADQDKKQAEAAAKLLREQREKRERENSLWFPPPAPQNPRSLGARLRKSV
jgi:hypothetical protein